MPHLQRKLLTFLIASLILVLLPSAMALAEGKAPPSSNSNFTMEGVGRAGEDCLPNDTSPGREFYAHVLITHEAGKTIQVAATAETIEGIEVTYIGPEIFVKSEEEHVGLTMHVVLKNEWKGLLAIGPWTWTSFNFYEDGYKIGEASELFELCSEEAGNHPPAIKGLVTITTQSGQSVLINVLTHASDPDGNALEVVGVSQVSTDRGYSNDPHNGRAFIEDNQIRYTPPAETRDYEVSFLYFISDGHGGWSEGAVVVEVLEGATTKLPSASESIPPEAYRPTAGEEFLREGTVPNYPAAPTTVNQPPKKGGAPYDLTLSKNAHISHNTVSVILTCHEGIECAGILNLKLGNRVVGAQQYKITVGRWIVRIKLTKAAARSIVKTKGRKLSIVASATCCRKTTVALTI